MSPHSNRFPRIAVLIASFVLAGLTSMQGQPARKHSWWKEPAGPLPNGVEHHRFHSPSMNIDVGYCIYLPPDYAKNFQARFPVVYWLHGGNGNELTGVPVVAPIADRAIRARELPPMIIVFVNGGPLWHYDDPKTGQLGETAFISELIPLIDRTYRTIADRNHRAIEGMSMGGRGTTRDVFKYPELFCSAAPIGAGYGNERKAVDAGQHLDNNVFFLAKKYAAQSVPPVRLLLVIGTKDFNYLPNLDYMKFLGELKLPFEKIILDGVSHSNKEYYARLKTATLRFHAESFRLARGK